MQFQVDEIAKITQYMIFVTGESGKKKSKRLEYQRGLDVY